MDPKTLPSYLYITLHSEPPYKKLYKESKTGIIKLKQIIGIKTAKTS